MNSPTLIKTYVAGAAIRGRRFAVFGSSDTAMIEAAAATDAIVGVFEKVDGASGDRVDVVLSGMTELLLGGTVVRGGPLTSDANGAAIAAAPAAGANARIGAFAMASGVAGDIIPALVQPGLMQGA
ncbi:hypothetical protein [Bosea sp. 685]|uniref:hypothetical protein n=1 Tax=Bosea sp. 685 TaxID=3080057 RepID=UPI002892ABDE|nr:hypothetical protein [Bosea sp. 685]WNJ89163.1 hypothetical protein RMR04_22495 [Bosea sp. 685]